MKINSNTSTARKLFFSVVALFAIGTGYYIFAANPTDLNTISRFGVSLMAWGSAVLAVYYGLWDEKAKP